MRIAIVEITDDPNIFLASPAGCLRRRGGVVSVHEQSARPGNPFSFQILRAQRDFRVALPENGSLAGGFIDQDVRRLAHATGRSDPAGVNSFAYHFVHRSEEHTSELQSPCN